MKYTSLHFTMSHSRHLSYWLILLLIFSIALVACERTIPPPDEAEHATPTFELEPAEDPFALPDPDPVTDPDPIDSYPPPEEAEPVPVDDEPPVAEPAPEQTEPDTPVQPGGTYTVQAGDTLFSIAQRYGLTVEELATANNIVNIHRLDIGQVLTIPAAGDIPPPGDPDDPVGEQIHVVQPGETLFRIALRYGVTVEALVSYNNIADPTRIDVGQQIRIPAR